MWKSTTTANVKVDVQEEDDWETDADFVVSYQ